MKRPGTIDAQIEAARSQLLVINGPKAAAWLIWIARTQLHAAGAVDYHFRPGEKEPRYFLYAMACLKRRPRRWGVETRKATDGGKDYRVRWYGWRSSGRIHPDVQRRERNARKRARKAWGLS